MIAPYTELVARETTAVQFAPTISRVVLSIVAACVAVAGVALAWQAAATFNAPGLVVDAIFVAASVTLAAALLLARPIRTIMVSGAVFGVVVMTAGIYVQVMIGWIYNLQYLPSAATGVALAVLAWIGFGVVWDESELRAGAAFKRLGIGSLAGIGVTFGSISVFLMAMAILWMLKG